MSIKEIVKNEHIRINVCTSADPLIVAIRIMAKDSVNGVAVVDKARRLIGIITGHDIVKALAGEDFVMDNAQVFQYMSTRVVTCNCNDNLSSALLKMKKHDIQHLVILDDKELVAILSMKDVLGKMHQNDVMELSVLKDIAVAHKVAMVN